MADITKCANWHGCPKAETCYRCTAPGTDNGWQAWGEFHPESPGLCFYKLETEQEEEVKK